MNWTASPRPRVLNEPVSVDTSEDRALLLDAVADPAHRREDFLIPPAPGGDYPLASYMAGNSLGLQPRSTRAALLAELDDWERHAVHGHMAGELPWMPYHEFSREPAARLVGAQPREVVVMNSLTVNLHLLLASFYRPTNIRHRIVIEDYAFSSDSYAVRSHVAFRGHDPDTSVLRLTPRPGEDTLRTDDVIAVLRDHAHSIATVMLGGVNYLTGEVMDMSAITRAGHEIGATVGWDLAHAAGNIPLALHDWDVDFAAWCSYKYLNSGPGAVAGAFVHERHLTDRSLHRLEGWWSTDQSVRFEMRPISHPPETADAWSLSNPPIMALAPVLASLRIFDEVGMDTLRARSLRLSAYVRELLDTIADTGISIVTPREPERHGTQVSVRVPATADVAQVTEAMSHDFGVVPDERPPDIIRIAPAPLYCTFHDCWRAVDALSRVLGGGGLA